MESSGAFIWKKDSVSEISSYRQPAGEDARLTAVSRTVLGDAIATAHQPVPTSRLME